MQSQNPPLHWDDFRLVRAIAERGGLTRAAESLGVNHSTAFRRLAAIEAALGARLFERHRSGYAPTPAGASMLLAAGRMDEDVSRFTRELAGQSSDPAGELRVTAPAGVVTDILMPMLGRFSARHPRILLDLVISEERLNLSRRDADVAIRASDQPPPNLVGRRVATMGWALYGRGEFAGRELSDCPWVCPGEGVAGGRFIRFAESRGAGDRIVMRLNAVIGLREAIEAGIGVGPLLRYDADARAGLVRLSESLPELSSSLWLLTHPDLRHAPRVRVFMDFMADEMSRLRPVLESAVARS